MKNTKRFLLIITAAVFMILLVLNTVTLTFVSFEASSIMLSILRTVNAASAALLSFVTASHYRNLNKIHSGGDKGFGYYFKKIWFIVALVFGISLAASIAGALLGNAFVGGFRMRIENSFLQGAVLKIPLFIIYLAAVCHMFYQQGHREADRKVFNAHLKLLSMATALIFMLPGTVFDSMYYTQEIDSFWVNVQSAFSANIDVYEVDFTISSENPDFNMLFPILTVTLVAAVQITAAVFAYGRGKLAFLKKRLNPAEYETDEKC
ncbi:MAG: hypothetical protein FWH24_04050 [Oscillospiraceae bacterium]|nr:hypothetical protein [Oscillospiraceae bacterium]